MQTKLKKMSNTNYPVGDFLIRIKNASLARRREVVMPKSKLVKAVADTLKKMGYLSEVKVVGENVLVKLTYISKRPMLTNLKLISKPGLRVYKSVNDLEKYKGPSLWVVSTPKGIMSSKEAIKNRAGGEAIAEVT